MGVLVGAMALLHRASWESLVGFVQCKYAVKEVAVVLYYNRHKLLDVWFTGVCAIYKSCDSYLQGLVELSHNVAMPGPSFILLKLAIHQTGYTGTLSQKQTIALILGRLMSL